QHPIGVPRGQPDQAVPGFFFSRVGGVGGGDPVLGPPPGDREPAEGLADGLDAQDAGRPAEVVADLGEQAQRPGGAATAPGARALVQQGAQGLVEGGVQQGLGALGPGGLGPQAGQALGVEGADGVAGGGGRAAEVAGDQGGAVAGGAGQQSLAAAQG